MSAEDLIEIGGRTYVLATSALVDDRTRVLKHGDAFAVFDRYGDIKSRGAGEQGLFLEGTRFLSRCELLVEGLRPLLLNSTVKNDNTLLTVDLTTPGLYRDGVLVLERGRVHILRSKVLWRGVCYEHLRLWNYDERTADITLAFLFDADYADLFEVRGLTRAAHGRVLPTQVRGRTVALGYQGLDGIIRRVRIHADRAPEALGDDHMRLRIEVPPGEQRELELTFACDTSDRASPGLSYGSALRESARTLRGRRARDCSIFSSNEQFNDWLNRSQADIHMLVTYTEHGAYPYAGIPWFSTPFGRDGIITALEYLWVNPDIARGVLAYLAAHQATDHDPQREAEPGKILHEVRKGEMAALGEVPFRSYYGTVDATPLFVMLACEYHRRTADRPFIEAIWPNLQAAIRWMDMHADRDAEGFIDYERHNPRGLVHQGWKDSDDSIFHADGTPARGHIALCEVQGYVYAARRGLAALARMLGERAWAEELDARAETLKHAFNERFWCEELGTFALALDGERRPCRVRSSNAGHLLLTGIADTEHVRRTAETLLSPDSFSGWGVRTIAASEARYNPMAYHNGSVWPHDNALIGMGLARHGYKDKALRILTGLFDASMYADLHRLPELFCGFVRRRDEGPGLYPSACVPQAWAAASAFYLLQAALGLSFDATRREIRFDHPALPDYLDWLEIRNLRLGDASVDLVLTRHEKDVSVNLTRKNGEVSVAVVL